MSHPPRTVGTWLANAPSSRAPTAARTPSNGRGSARGAASGTRSSKRPSRCEGLSSRPPSLSSRRCRSRRSTRRNGSPGRRASASSTVCSAEGSSLVRSRSSAASPASASPRLLLAGGGLGRAQRARGVSTCRPRSRPRRCRAAPSGSARWSPGCGSSAESDPSRCIVALIDAVDPDFVVVDSIQTMHDPELGSAPGSVNQVRDSARSGSCEAKERRQSRPCSSATSPRRRPRRPARARARRSTPCSRSRATGTTRCGCCGRSSTASARPTSSACSR